MDRYLERFFKDHECSDHINLSNKFVGEKGARALKHFLLSHAGIVSLELQGNNFGSSSVELLACGLSNQPSLTTLSLEWNPILDSAGLTRLASVIGLHPCIQKLNLRECQIGSSGAGALCDMIAKNRSLREIDLAHNHLGPEGVSIVARGLQDNCSITSLNLTGNGASQDQLCSVENILVRNRCFKRPCTPCPGSPCVRPCVSPCGVVVSEKIVSSPCFPCPPDSCPERTVRDELCRTAQLLSETRQELSARAAEGAALRTEAQEKGEKVAETSAALKTTQLSLKETQETLSIRQEEAERLRTRLNEKSTQVAELLSNRQDLERELAETAELATQREREIGVFQKRLADRRGAFEELREKHEAAHKDMLKHMERADKFEAEADKNAHAAKENRAALESRTSELEQLIKTHKAEVQGAEEALKQARRTHLLALKDSETQTQKVRETLNERDRELRDATAELVQAQTDVRAKQLEIHQKEDAMRELQSLFDAKVREAADRELQADKRAATAEREKAQLLFEFNAAKDTIKGMEQQLHQRLLEVDQLRSEGRQKDKEVQDAKLENMTLQKEIQMKERQIGDVQSQAKAREDELRNRVNKAYGQVKNAFEGMATHLCDRMH